MGKGKTLLEEVSPHGNVQAIVEQDDRVAHFYLWGGPDSSFGMRSCWVRNLKPAPADLKVADMRAGAAPMLPRPRCKHPEGAPPLSAKGAGRRLVRRGRRRRAPGGFEHPRHHSQLERHGGLSRPRA